MKVLIVGCAGAGKTTIGKKIATYTNTPFFSLDDFYWQPKWRKTPAKDFENNIKDILSLDSCIIDGLYPEVLRQLEIESNYDFAILYIKTTKCKSIYRVIKRTILRILTKEKICNGNVEKVSNLIGKSNIILYSIRTFKKTKMICERLVYEHPSSMVITLDTKVEKIIENLYTNF